MISTAYCVASGIPLFIASRPKTPLRVLCIIAFDTIYLLRTSQRISISQTRTLAAILDFGACANAALDGKHFCPNEYKVAQERLETAGLAPLVESYVRRLRELESQRPLPGGLSRNFSPVQHYRESVVTLSLGMIVAAIFGSNDIQQGMGAIHRDNDFRILFRIVMQCQIIDDILDYSKDLRSELPGFLTATDTLRESIEMTDRASCTYGNSAELVRSTQTFTLRLALFALTAAARICIHLAHFRAERRLLLLKLPR